MNTVTMMLYYWKSPELGTYMHREDQADEIVAVQRHEYTVTLDWVNVGFTVIFFLEMNVKLLGFGLWQYFRDSWCTFDFFVVWATIVSLLGSDLMPAGSLSFVIVRYVRVWVRVGPINEGLKLG